MKSFPMTMCLMLITGCSPFLSQDDLTDRLDVDGDGLSFVDGEDCDDRDGNVGGPSVWYVDMDRDGFGGEEFITSCDQPPGYVAESNDCDDMDPNVNPDATEVCDGIDNNCNGQIDEGVTPTWYIDVDDDGYGGTQTTTACDQPDGYVSEGGDCDDTNANVNPNATEVCDGIDNNCNGQIDEGVTPTWYIDADGDGYGSAEDTLEQCDQPSGYVDNSDDCDDTRANVYPGAEEICDSGIDEDCNGIIDDAEDAYIWYTDADGDGFGDPDTLWATCQDNIEGYVDNGDDCDDTDPFVNPDAIEICNDGIDNDCNGIIDTDASSYDWYPDVDGDGYGDETATPVYDCEPPTEDYVTDNTDCDDTDPNVNPGETEVCDGIDNNCDGDVDEGLLSIYYVDADGDGYGDSGAGTTEECTLPSGYALVDGDCDDTDPNVNPGETEVCRDWIDNDCDGTANTCEFTGTLSVSDADVAWTGTASDNYTGYELLGGCDLNDDGVPDVVFGANNESSLATNGGAVYIDTSPTTGSIMASSSTIKIFGSKTDGHFGYSLACLDANGDGSDDLAIGAYGVNGSTGWIYVFLGPISSGTTSDTAADISRMGVESGSYTGWTLAAGDYDGDGYDDLAMGSPWSDSVCGSNSGGVYVEYGPMTLYNEHIDEYATFLCGEEGDYAGMGLLSVDTDLDGIDDLLVGAPGNDEAGTDAGIIYILDSGPGTTTDSLSNVANYTLEGENADDGAGSYFAKGDVNGDGYDDVIIGVNLYDDVGINRGALYTFYTSLTRSDASLSTADIQLVGLNDYDNLGTDACVADVNGDGDNDLIVSVYGDDTITTNNGAIYAWMGPISSTISTSSVDAEILGVSSGDRAGERLEYAGDYDGDGYEDILITARFTSSNAGTVYLYAGTGL
jgi:hypothetical protein